jgi:hypothetical protein
MQAETVGTPTSSRTERELRLTLLPLLVTGATWYYLSQRFEIVDGHSADLLVIGLLSAAVAAVWCIRRPHETEQQRALGQLASWRFVRVTLGTAFLFAALFPTLNALLDHHSAMPFSTVVADSRCHRGSCSWVLRGAPVLPVAGTSMTVDHYDGFRRPTPGDSLMLQIKPGFLGRRWIAASELRVVDRSQLACAQLSRAAIAGDTTALGTLLARGLAIDADEPALACDAPLMAAAQAGQARTVAFLLERGANPNHARPDGETPLMNAVRARSLATVQLLIAHGADPQAIARPGGLMTSVMALALDVGDTAIVGVVAKAIPPQASLRGSRP